MVFFNGFFGGPVEQLTDIRKQLRPGRRGVVFVRAAERYSTVSLIYRFHSTPINIFHFYCGFFFFRISITLGFCGHFYDLSALSIMYYVYFKYITFCCICKFNSFIHLL